MDHLQLLVQLDGHILESILILDNFRLLASCSSIISIWMKKEFVYFNIQSTTLDNSITTYKEHWETILTFSGHSTDIIDISWSPNDHFIASASLDNTIKIWNISLEACKKVAVSTPYKELKGHIGWVMGISWDSLGRV